MNKQDSQTIKQAAHELGFDDCRICSAEPVAQRERDSLRNWLDQGMNGTMGWFGKSQEARADISTRFPWAKSVIVVRKDYASAKPEFDPKRIANRIARYALAYDYHDLLREPLAKLQDAVLACQPEGSEAKALWYVDTGPILEHSYAQRAGIGWTGKHTLTLHNRHGSYFFIAEIVTSLELEHDEGLSNHCGTCTRCIDACPTQAITEPYVLDARRCISYLTIEHKGAIDESYREQMSGYLFGCDICQQACPYNEKVEARLPEQKWRHENLEALNLSDVLHMPDDALLELLKGTPLHRTGSERLKRNALLLAGAERNDDLFDGVVVCLSHPDEMVREASAWALGCYQGDIGERARALLGRHQREESEDVVRSAIVDSLARLNSGNA